MTSYRPKNEVFGILGEKALLGFPIAYADLIPNGQLEGFRTEDMLVDCVQETVSLRTRTAQMHSSNAAGTVSLHCPIYQ